MAGERDGLANDCRVGGETALPEAVAEDDDLLALFAWEEATAEGHAKLRYVEIVRCGGLSPEALGFTFAADGGGHEFVVGGEAGEGFCLVAQIGVNGPGEGAGATVLVGGFQSHECAGVAYRGWREHEAADHGEDGRVGGDAESDGEDDGEHEAGRFGKTPDGIGQVLPQLCHGFSVWYELRCGSREGSRRFWEIVTRSEGQSIFTTTCGNGNDGKSRSFALLKMANL